MSSGSDSASYTPSHRGDRTRPRLSVRDYVFIRLGTPHGPWQAAQRMLMRSFGAKSFVAFWRYWNPVYGYFLYYWSYRPLRRYLPRPIALVLTFALCGFLLHDIVHLAFTGMPLVTMWFVVLGVGAYISEALRMDLSRQPYTVRAGTQLLYLLGSFEAARRLVLLLFGGTASAFQ